VSEENVELVRRINALANAADLDALFELFHPEVEFRDIQHGPDVPESFWGRAAGRLVVENWTAAYDDFGAEVSEYIDADPWVICETRWHGKGKESGVPIDGHAADAYEVADGKVIRAILGFADLATALKAVGPEGSAVSHENVEVVRRFLLRSNEQELDAALLDVAPAAELDWSASEGPDSGVYRGREEWRVWLTGRLEGLTDGRFGIDEVINVPPDTVVVVGYMRGRGRVSGVEVEAFGASVWTVRAGKVTAATMYQARDQALKAVGLDE
jgi:ketosteroid isomerase-like protein